MITYFTNTVSRIGGITLKDIETQVEYIAYAAFDPLGLEVDLTWTASVRHKMRSGKEEHLVQSKHHSSSPAVHQTRRL